MLVGKDGEPRLLDFGIARPFEDERPRDRRHHVHRDDRRPTRPEQVQRKPLTTSSDVYSLGVMLYQLLSGVRPYELADLSPAQAERTICETAPVSLATAVQRAPLADAERERRRAAIGEDLDCIVAKAMHKEPQRRYASAQNWARTCNGSWTVVRCSRTGFARLSLAQVRRSASASAAWRPHSHSR